MPGPKPTPQQALDMWQQHTQRTAAPANAVVQGLYDAVAAPFRAIGSIQWPPSGPGTPDRPTLTQQDLDAWGQHVSNGSNMRPTTPRASGPTIFDKIGDFVNSLPGSKYDINGQPYSDIPISPAPGKPAAPKAQPNVTDNASSKPFGSTILNGLANYMGKLGGDKIGLNESGVMPYADVPFRAQGFYGQMTGEESFDPQAGLPQGPKRAGDIDLPPMPKESTGAAPAPAAKSPSANDTATLGLRRAISYPGISSEELWKQAFRPQEQVAPGANQWPSHTLQDRLDADEFDDQLWENAQKTLSEANTSMNPTVQAALEASARRAAYPAAEQGKALIESQRLKNQDPYTNAMAKLLEKQAASVGSGNIHSINRYGLTFENDPNMAPYMKDLLTAQKNAAGGFFGPSAQSKAALEQAQQNVLNRYPFQGSDPNRARMILQQVLLNPNAEVDPTGLTDEDVQEIESVFSLLTGEALQ